MTTEDGIQSRMKRPQPMHLVPRCAVGRTEVGASTGLDFDARVRANIRMARGKFELALEGTISSDFIPHVRQK